MSLPRECVFESATYSGARLCTGQCPSRAPTEEAQRATSNSTNTSTDTATTTVFGSHDLIVPLDRLVPGYLLVQPNLADTLAGTQCLQETCVQLLRYACAAYELRHKATLHTGTFAGDPSCRRYLIAPGLFR